MLKTAEVCLPLGLSGGFKSFRYTSSGGGTDVVKGVDDVKEYKEMLEAMADLGFTQDEQESSIQITAGVLHLGNVTFDPTQVEAATGGAPVNGSKISASGPGADALAHVARLLGVDAAAARAALTQRSITVRGTKVSFFYLPRTVILDAYPQLTI